MVFLFSINANLSPAVSVIPFYDKSRFFNLEILEFFMVYAYLVGFINSISTSSEVSVKITLPVFVLTLVVSFLICGFTPIASKGTKLSIIDNS